MLSGMSGDTCIRRIHKQEFSVLDSHDPCSGPCKDVFCYC